MTQQWVSFQEIKERVSIEDILRHYDLLSQLNSAPDGDELVGLCPFHPDKKTKSFRASRSKNAFNCFSPACGKHGNILDFVRLMETIELLEAALLIQSWFGEESHITQELNDPLKNLAEVDQPAQAPINPPLTFALENAQWRHEYLSSRGVKKETLQNFGVGYYSGNGMLSKRIVFPIHDINGKLIAYAARWPSNDLPEDQDRYLRWSGFFRQVAKRESRS